MLLNFYQNIIFKYPKLVIALFLLITLFCAAQMKNFRLDASSESLVLENDDAVAYYNEIKKKYGGSSDNYLFITYTPQQEIFTTQALDKLQKLQDRLNAISDVKSVTSILNVPLITSSNSNFKDLAANKIITLANSDIDLELVREEFISSPLYSNLLVSSDSKSTALLVNLVEDDIYAKLIEKRNMLQEEYQSSAEKSALQLAAIKAIEKQLTKQKTWFLQQQNQAIDAVRQVIKEFAKDGKIHLGGVPMIVVDSINFIKKDVVTFGIGVLLFIVILLFVIFRTIYFVIAPLIICSAVAVMMVGILALLNWPVTIVSSNFIALLLIFTLSIMIHLIVNYREARSIKIDESHQIIITRMLRKMGTPCFYTSITTIVAFASLIISDIRPVIDFGWMMVIGLTVAFVVSFTVFPAILCIIKPSYKKLGAGFTHYVTNFFAKLVLKYRVLMLILFAVFTVINITALKSLTVENRFIDYYKDTTEIHQGMKLIDQQFGGTMPLDIVIDAPKEFFEMQELATDNIFGMEEDFIDDQTDNQGYWLNSFNLPDIAAIHNYLDNVPEIGKLLSFHTTLSLLTTLNNKNDIDGFILNIVAQKMPQNIKDILFSPYISEDGNQIRFTARIFESYPDLNRSELLTRIRNHLENNLNIKSDELHLNGMLVLYNNILNSLFQSQIMTLGVVFLAILFMFTILFRNIKLAVITIIPNMIAAVSVLGVMGLLNIPLDIMTITIAAICVGIAVDDAIHYVHRFISEVKKDNNYSAAIERSHESIGSAMYYTTITIILGFSLLIFSNFIPTIYFGLLTALAMLFALLANMILLPILLNIFKPIKT